MQADEVTQQLRSNLGFELHQLSPDSVTIETTGLEKFDRPNLQIAGIPRALAPIAQRYMLEVAAYSVAVKPVRDGQTVAVPWEKGHNVVRAVESQSVRAKAGWFRRKRPTVASGRRSASSRPSPVAPRIARRASPWPPKS
jgi:hypothetical protein